MRPCAVLTLWICGLFWTFPAFAQDGARYRLDVTLRWTAETHPVAFPTNPHFSSFIGAVHSSRYTLFRDGDTATSGLALVATNGRTSVLQAELAEAQRRRRVADVFTASGLASGVGTKTVEFEVSPQHSWVSFATMIAPSPDWFTGIANQNLMRDGSWIDDVTLPLWAWDAGADSGESYIAADAETQPRQSIRLVSNASFLDSGGLKSVGQVVITRLD